MIAQSRISGENVDETEARLRAALGFCIRMLKSQAGQISDLSEEIAVLAGTVRGLDPTFDDVWKQKKAEIASGLLPLKQELLARYEEILHSIESGEL